MKQWKKAFEIWENFCPFTKRKLLSKERFVRWAESLGLTTTTRRDDFLVFLMFLEECEIICPLTLSSDRSGFDTETVYFYEHVELEQEIAYYHPLQFFEVINWYNHATSNKPPYYFSPEFREYYSLRKMEYNLKDYKQKIEDWKGMDLSIDFTKEHLEKLEKQLEERKLKGKTSYPNGINLLKQLKIGGFTSEFINEEYLIVWIKLESLLLEYNAAIFAPNPPRMNWKVSPRDQNELQKCIDEYKLWRQNLIDNKENYFTEIEIKAIKSFHFYLGQKIGDGPFGTFGTKGNWMDLFDIIPPQRKNKLEGLTSIYVNLLSFKRYIERAYWELFKKNILYDRETDDKPYFFGQGEGDYRVYVKSVLLQFELFPSNPFILYVEGESDRAIIIEYINKKSGLRFKIKNMQGINNADYHMKVSEDTEDHEYYFFFDFDSVDKYNSRREEYRDKCSFFFPDFMTENFTVDEFNEALISWIDFINLDLTGEHKSKIYELLMQEKEKSNILIEDINSGAELTERNTKGYEKISINYLRLYFRSELSKLFPESIGLDDNGWMLKSSKKYFDDLFKEGISNRLKQLIIDSMELDPRREHKFQFEIKLQPFWDKLLTIVNRTPYYL